VLAATAGAAAVASGATGVPHSAQNRPVAVAPHEGHVAVCGVPHDGQNFADAARPSPHDEQLATSSFLPSAQRECASFARCIVDQRRRVRGAALIAEPLGVLQHAARMPVRRPEGRERRGCRLEVGVYQRVLTA
jgi:hypothetical protein